MNVHEAQTYAAIIAYAADYRPIRIIDLGQTIYRPPPKSKCECSVECCGAWAIVTAWTRVFALL